MLDIRPIVVNKDGVVLGGNMRLKACKEAGLTEVPVIHADTLTEDQQREFIIKDNLGYGAWDWEMIKMEWNTDELEQWGLELPDFSTLDGEQLPENEDIQDDNFDMPDEIHTDIVAGDLIEIGQHRLLCGDSTNADDMAKLMNGQLATLAHNDPPYGMKKEAEGVANDNLNTSDLLKFNAEWINLQFTHLVPNGSWYCWGIDEPLMDIYQHILKPYFKNGRATFRNLITWDKDTGQGQMWGGALSYAIATEKALFVMCGKIELTQNKDQFPEEWRHLLTYFREEKERMGWKITDVIEITGKSSASHYFTESQFQVPTAEHYQALQDASDGQAFQKPFEELKKGANKLIEKIKSKRPYFDNQHDNMNNVWHFERTHIKERENVGGHVTPKPLELCGRAIKSSSPKGALVLDAFIGSGSTMVAAHKLGRVCYGMELEPKFCQVTLDRMKKIDNSLNIKINGKPYK